VFCWSKKWRWQRWQLEDMCKLFAYSSSQIIITSIPTNVQHRTENNCKRCI